MCFRTMKMSFIERLYQPKCESDILIIVQIKSWPNEWKHYYQQFGIFMLAFYGSLHITELNVRRKN